MTHDYTRKGGVVHTEIMLPPHAPPSFSDRSTLWNLSLIHILKAFDPKGVAEFRKEWNLPDKKPVKKKGRGMER